MKITLTRGYFCCLWDEAAVAATLSGYFSRWRCSRPVDDARRTICTTVLIADLRPCQRKNFRAKKITSGYLLIFPIVVTFEGLKIPYSGVFLQFGHWIHIPDVSLQEEQNMWEQKLHLRRLSPFLTLAHDGHIRYSPMIIFLSIAYYWLTLVINIIFRSFCIIPLSSISI